jgi:hypothetical protein
MTTNNKVTLHMANPQGRTFLNGLNIVGDQDCRGKSSGAVVVAGGIYVGKHIRAGLDVSSATSNFGKISSHSGLRLNTNQSSTIASQAGVCSTVKSLQEHENCMAVVSIDAHQEHTSIHVRRTGSSWSLTKGDFIQLYGNTTVPHNNGLYMVMEDFSESDCNLLLKGNEVELSFVDLANANTIVDQSIESGFILPVQVSVINNRTDTGVFQQGTGHTSRDWVYTSLSMNSTYPNLSGSEDICLSQKNLQLVGDSYTYNITNVTSEGLCLILPRNPLEGQKHKFVRKAIEEYAVGILPGLGHRILGSEVNHAWLGSLQDPWDCVIFTFNSSDTPAGFGHTWTVGM